MTRIEYPVLCGGTFFTLLLQARKPGTSSRNHTGRMKNNFQEKDVLGALAKVVIPELGKDISRPGCSEFKSCKKPFFAVVGTDPQSEYCEAFNKRVKTQYTSALNAMEELAAQYISSDIHVQTCCAERLLDLICKDESIQQNEIFYVDKHGQALKEAALTGAELNIYLPALLLGIWHFTVIHRKNNTLGAATFENWHEQKIGSNLRSRREFISEIGTDFKGKIHMLSERIEDSIDFDLSEPGADDNTSQGCTPNDAGLHIPQGGAAEIAVPQECRICLCCKDWQGQVGRALLASDGIYGECEAFGKRTLSTDCCGLFRVDSARISQHQAFLPSLGIWKKLWGR